MMSFKQFLIEGGKATAKFNTDRANSSDIEKALEFVHQSTNIPLNILKSNLLGSTRLTYAGKKPDSGDIDIAIPFSEYPIEGVNDKMLKAVSGEGTYNAGTKVGSYAVPVNGKKVQVDLMFVSNADWATWMYSSFQGEKSKYPGVVRNIILFAALAHTQEKDKDFVIRDDEGKPVIRASKSITMDSGMKRLFKMAKFNEKTGKYNKTISTVTPEEIENHLKKIGKNIKFSKDLEHTNNPDDIAKFIFGKGVKAKDLDTAEQVIAQIKKLPNAREIIAASKSELTRIGLEVPKELE